MTSRNLRDIRDIRDLRAAYVDAHGAAAINPKPITVSQLDTLVSEALNQVESGFYFCSKREIDRMRWYMKVREREKLGCADALAGKPPEAPDAEYLSAYCDAVIR